MRDIAIKNEIFANNEKFGLRIKEPDIRTLYNLCCFTHKTSQYSLKVLIFISKIIEFKKSHLHFTFTEIFLRVSSIYIGANFLQIFSISWKSLVKFDHDNNHFYYFRDFVALTRIVFVTCNLEGGTHGLNFMRVVLATYFMLRQKEIKY